METIYLILALAWSVLVLILFFKVWGMTNDVKSIRQLLKNVSSKNLPQSSYDENKAFTEIGDLTKGNVYQLKKFGDCIYEGLYDGRYFFYLRDKSYVSDSPYFTGGDEPYVSLPKSELGNYIIR